MFQFSEYDEVADAMIASDPQLPSFDDAVLYVLKQMPGESEAVISIIAERLYAQVRIAA